MNERTSADSRLRRAPILAVLVTVLLVLPVTATIAFADCIDGDGDGYGFPGDASCPGGSEPDCDDANGDVYPGAPEVCDGVSNDCDHVSWPSTTAWTTRQVGIGETSVFAADVDGDDDVDVLTVDNAEEGRIAWYSNTAGDGSAWIYHVIAIYSSFPQSVFGADLDGDDDLDVLAGGEVSGGIRWYENESGDGAIWSVRILSPVDDVVSLFAADVDGDGRMDVLSASESGDKITWHESTSGNGSTWSDHVITTSADGARSVFAADVDGDDDLDVLSASLNDDKIAWYENTAGDGSAWSEHVVSTSADGAASVFVADVDGDGDPDLLSASRFDDKIAWYENMAGDGSAWSEHVISTSADGGTSVFALDLDGDGDVDVLAASYDGHTIASYENTAGDGSAWAEREISTSAYNAGSVFAADVDGNGEPDALAASVLGTPGADGLAWYGQERFDGDLDGDGMAICDGDCDDHNPHCDVDCADVDGDGFCVTTDCDDDNPHCDVDCADVDRDGYCVTEDCDDADTNNWLSCATCTDSDDDDFYVGCDRYRTIDGPDCDDCYPFCTIDCVTDLDSDGIPYCADTCVDEDGDEHGDPAGAGDTCAGSDCDDANPDCALDCTDGDGDLVCLDQDCDDADPNNWVSCSTCADADGDTAFAGCDAYGGIDGPDCDDTDADVYPGALEVCDGVNNDCDNPSWPLTFDWVYRQIGYGETSLFAGDVDGDDDLDVLTVRNNEEGSVTWYENAAGDASDWDYHYISPFYYYPYSVFGADMDGDNDLDFLTAAEFSGHVSWWENTAGDGSDWEWHSIFWPNYGSTTVFAADLEGDGDMDVASASFEEDTIRWYQYVGGTGTGWSDHVVSASADGATSVFAADLDGDDDLDLLSASREDDKITWYENTEGDASVWTEREISTSAQGARSVFASDMDGDHDLDVLSASQDDDKIAWYENTVGDGSVWTEREISTSADRAWSVFAADVDADGDMDALSASYDDDKIAWYENVVGDGSEWNDHVISTSANRAKFVLAADLDGDGDLNVLAASATTSGDHLAWYDQERFDGDGDGDGLAVCAGDCNDGNSTVYPGASETNDGIDNQCPGDEGHGLIDEIEGECGFHDPGNRDEYSWNAQPGATVYEVARFEDSGNPINCTMIPTVDTFVIDPEEPVAGKVFHYLVRALTPHVGSWGQDSQGIERTNVCP